MNKINILIIYSIFLITLENIFFSQDQNINTIQNNNELINIKLTNLSNVEYRGYNNNSKNNIEINNNNVYFYVDLEVPGDKYSFNIDVKNCGIKPLKLKLKQNELENNAKEYINWSITGIKENEIIKSQESKTLTVTIEYNPEITVPPTEPIDTKFNIDIMAKEDL